PRSGAAGCARSVPPPGGSADRGRRWRRRPSPGGAWPMIPPVQVKSATAWSMAETAQRTYPHGMDHPDLIYVIADQWRAQDLGYAGNPEVHTPHLDACAAEAVDGHLAVSASPVCTPARASLLTGLLPHRHRLVCNDVPLDPDLPSLGKAFAAAGY